MVYASSPPTAMGPAIKKATAYAATVELVILVAVFAVALGARLVRRSFLPRSLAPDGFVRIRAPWPAAALRRYI